MANIARCLNQVTDDHAVIGVVSAADTLDDGYIVVADELTADSENVYTATKPAAITDGNLAIVVGDKVYEDANGNRILINDPTQIDYKAGRAVRAYRPEMGMRFAVDQNAIDSGTVGNVAVGKYLIPKASSYLMDVADDLTGGSVFAFKVEKVSTFSVGIETVANVIVRVVKAEMA